MSISITCRELGMDCEFATEADTEKVVIDSLMRHVHDERRPHEACGVTRAGDERKGHTARNILLFPWRRSEARRMGRRVLVRRTD